MKKYLIFGLGLSGVSALKLLQNRKDIFYLYDDNSATRQNVFDKFKMYKNVFGVNILDKTILEEIDVIIVSPAIPLSDKRLSLARKMHKKIVGELEVGHRHAKSKIIAITGTNGKTTTTSLIQHILHTAHKRSVACGNIGYPLSSAVKDIRGGYLVCEVSSFQLESTLHFKPYIACLLNITPDHLDRHKNMSRYRAIKYSIFKNMDKNSYAILNDNLPLPQNFSGKVLKFTHNSQKNCIFDAKNDIFYNNGKKSERILSIDDITLVGEKNIENVMCAVLVCKLCGVKNKYIVEGIRSFSPHRHRLEKVYEKNNKSFYDDSKATNVDATKSAVASLKNKGNIRIILGGSDKGERYDKLCRFLSKSVTWAYITGNNKDKIASSFRRCHFDRFTSCHNFHDAVALALCDMERGDILLLSPASASFDEFKNYSERGEKFLEIIKNYYEK